MDLPRSTPSGLRVGELAAVAGGLLTAIGLRLLPLTSEFPVGDGALFWTMASEMRDSGFVPPATTAYNGDAIPWMYPPVGISMLAVAGGDLDMLRVLPVLFTVATIPALWLLAQTLVGPRAALLAAVAYGLAPSAYQGLVAGGGVTRAPGVLFALLTMWAVADRRAVPAGILAGLTILTHPLAAFYAGIGSAALWLTRGAERRMVVAPIIAAAMGVAWYGPMVVRHGIEPLLSGLGSRGGPDVLDSAILFLRLALYPPTLAVLAGIAGAIVAWRQRRWDLLVWLAVTAVGVGVNGRWTIIPLSVLAGLALDIVARDLPSRRAVAAVAVAVAFAVTSVALTDTERPITSDERATMAWLRDNTPPDATVAPIGYAADGGVVEWMPALSLRRSVTTAQGTEWLRDGDHWDEARAAVSCGSVECLPEADYYVLRPGCCPELSSALSRVGPDVYRRLP